MNKFERLSCSTENREIPTYIQVIYINLYQHMDWLVSLNLMTIITIAVSLHLNFSLLLQIKSSIVKEVSTVNAGNLQTLTQVTSVIARATLEPSQVTFDTQVWIITFCTRAADVSEFCFGHIESLSNGGYFVKPKFKLANHCERFSFLANSKRSGIKQIRKHYFPGNKPKLVQLTWMKPATYDARFSIT